GEDLVQPPEEVIGPIETLILGASAAVVIGFPWIVGGDAGHLVEFGGVGNGIAIDRAAGGGDDIDLVLQDKVVGDLRGATLVGLAVLGDDLDLVGLAADFQPLLKIFANVREHPV